MFLILRERKRKREKETERKKKKTNVRNTDRLILNCPPTRDLTTTKDMTWDQTWNLSVLQPDELH